MYIDDQEIKRRSRLQKYNLNYNAKEVFSHLMTLGVRRLIFLRQNNESDDQLGSE